MSIINKLFAKIAVVAIVVCQAGCVEVTYRPLMQFQFETKRSEMDMLIADIRAPLKNHAGITSYYSRDQHDSSGAAYFTCKTLPLLFVTEIPGQRQHDADAQVEFALDIFPMSSLDKKTSDAILRALEKYVPINSAAYDDVRIKYKHDEVFNMESDALNLDDQCKSP